MSALNRYTSRRSCGDGHVYRIEWRGQHRTNRACRQLSRALCRNWPE